MWPIPDQRWLELGQPRTIVDHGLGALLIDIVQVAWQKTLGDATTRTPTSSTGPEPVQGVQLNLQWWRTALRGSGQYRAGLQRAALRIRPYVVQLGAGFGRQLTSRSDQH